ncbi:MAG: bifunctional pyr operon transcriptional regulator/uracil phosphoribosyltransferase PyrR [Verrucomicrobiae bacterium]|nr:bifunctional pyr operon transcriptional regulator/uracil phosphoribosyltransferase PyrR [Verrucomicrobiae bacterium]
MTTAQPPSHEEIAEAINRLVLDLAEAYSESENVVVIAIARGGVELGKRISSALGDKLGREIPCGVVDISFHRDDISSNPVPHIQTFANLPFDVEEKTVILVDDVIFSGRSVRAALNEIFDQGRPKKVSLAVLIDRGGRSLPIQADFTGMTLKLASNELIKVYLDDSSSSEDSVSITS